ncbi:hypothetical protein OXYTRIMIC_109 [Oxytricha trifallax]|uniref:Uncharacterized protein n=1 Tax=Oxytricha trifallax TaxID=1172189 RepID=A0A073IB32_9SPIT|nr:hypothetical protein OXYTRIMIC_109 [Oxytricha trifallax]
MYQSLTNHTTQQFGIPQWSLRLDHWSFINTHHSQQRNTQSCWKKQTKQRLNQNELPSKHPEISTTKYCKRYADERKWNKRYN